MIDGVLKALKLAPRLLFVVWVLGAIILFAPDTVLARFGLSALRDAHRPWIGLATLAGVVTWSTHALVDAWGWARRAARRRAARRDAIANLDRLSREESELLAYFLFRRAPTQSLFLHLPPARSLEEKGLLRAARGMGNMLAWPHTVPPDVWEALQVRRAELFPDLETPEAQRHLSEYDRRMHDLALYGQ